MDSVESQNSDISDINQIYTDQRTTSRHQTTLVIDEEPKSDRSPRRGDINRDGAFFIPEPHLRTGEQIALKLRLPGLGEWVKCRGLITGTAVRGASTGIVGRITELHSRSAETMAIWQEMSKYSENHSS